MQEINHHLSVNGLRYIGTIDVVSRVVKKDHSWFILAQNFNDINSPLILSAGCRILASNVVAFVSGIKTTVGHSAGSIGAIQSKIESLVQSIHSRWSEHDQRLVSMKETHLSFDEMSGILIKALEARILNGRQVSEVFSLYRKPRQTVFASASAWSLYNAILSVKMSVPIPALIGETIKVTSLFEKLLSINVISSPFVQENLL